MSTNPASIEECRSFVAALCNDTDDKRPVYITAEKRGRYWVYCNSFVEDYYFKTQNVLDTAKHTFSLITAEATKIGEQERIELLEHMTHWLGRYKKRVKKSMWIETLCGFLYRKAFHQIDVFRDEIKRELEHVRAEEKPTVGEKAQALLQQIKPLRDSCALLPDLKDEVQLVDFMNEQLEQIAKLREQAIELPWNECLEVYKNIFAIQKELRFCFLQKNALLETKRLLKQIKEELADAKKEYTQKLNSVHGTLGLINLSAWAMHTPSGIVYPLLKNRFFKLSPEDSQCQEAVQVSKEIADCIEFSHYLEHFKSLVSQDFQEMMKNHEKDLLQATKGAQGNGALLAAIERLNLAAKQNAPWMFFNLKALPPDLQSFEKDARTAAVLVHPDKNQDHLETAEILIKIHNDIVTWIKQKHYQS